MVSETAERVDIAAKKAGGCGGNDDLAGRY
jgi:hypothetical protein